MSADVTVIYILQSPIPTDPNAILITDNNGNSLGITLNDPGAGINVTDESGADLGITL